MTNRDGRYELRDLSGIISGFITISDSKEKEKLTLIFRTVNRPPLSVLGSLK